MSILVVQHKSLFQSASTSVLAFTSNNTASNLLAYFTMSDGAPAAATDSNSNTIANATSVLNGTSNGAVRADYVASCNAGANTVTGHRGGSTGGTHLHIYEVSGCATATPLRDTGKVVSSATFSVSTTGSSSLSGDAVFGAFYDFVNNATLTAGSGFNPSELTPDSASGDAGLSEFKAATANGTQTATGSGNGTDVLQQVIVVFKQASASSVVFEEDEWQPPPPTIPIPPIQALRDAEDAPALYGQYDEDFWQNPTPPLAGALYQPLPLGDPEELPAADLTATVDEYLWQNPTPPIIGTFLYPNPWSDDQTPQFAVPFQPDEDFWLNPAAPAIGALAPIYLPNPEEIPAASLTATVDEYFWFNPLLTCVQPQLWQQQWSYDPSEVAAPTVSFQPDEDLWLVLPQMSFQPAATFGAWLLWDDSNLAGAFIVIANSYDQKLKLGYCDEGGLSGTPIIGGF